MERIKITKAASLFSFATVLSRLFGFIRDMVIAKYLGATGFSDAFFVAFRIPNLLRELFAEGSISSAFIPVLSEVNKLHGKDELKKIINKIFTFILLITGIVCIIGIIFTPLIVKAIAPGFSDERLTITVNLTRIMFPFLLFISLAACIMGALNLKNCYFIPAFAPIWFNLSIIIILILWINNPLLAAAVGVTIGGFMQFIIQIPSFFKKGYSLNLRIDFKDKWLKKMILLTFPTMAGFAVSQVNIFVSTILASLLPEGSIAYLYYSMRLVQFPVGVFGVAMAIAVLPSLSKYSAESDFVSLGKDFSYSLRLLMFVSIPAMIGLIALRIPIINLLFQRGEFDYSATEKTAFSLLFYSLGIWSMVGSKVVIATFYSMQDTKTPVKIATLSVLMNILLSVILIIPLKHGGLALSNTISSWLNFSILLYILKKRLKNIEEKEILKSISKIIIASIIMGIISWLSINNISLWHTSGNLIKKILLLSITITFSILIYLLLSIIFRIQQLKDIVHNYKKSFASYIK